MGKNINVMVHKARDLEKQGILGKADPYVKVTVGEKTVKSKTVKNNYNPEWQFGSSFTLDEKLSNDIQIEVFDEDIGKDDKLGHKILKIEEILSMKNIVNQWVVLEGCKSGEILLSIELIRMKANEKDKIDTSKREIVHDKMFIPDMKKESPEI